MCVHDEQLQWCISGSEDILEVVTFPVRLWHIWIIKAVSYFIIGSFFPADSINLKHILFILKLTHLNFNVLIFKSVVNLLLGLTHKLFTDLLSLKLFLSQGEIQLTISLRSHYVYRLSILHNTCNEKFILRKLIHLGKIELYLILKLTECEKLFCLLLYLHLMLCLISWTIFIGHLWNPLPTGGIGIIVTISSIMCDLVVLIHGLDQLVTRVIWVWFDDHLVACWFLLFWILCVGLFILI